MWRHNDPHDIAQVTDWMQALAATPLEVRPPHDPAFLWWKAQLLRRWDAERRVDTALEAGERVQTVIGVAGALVLLAWLWRSLPHTAVAAAVALPILGGGLLLVAAVALAAWAASGATDRRA